MNCTTGQCETTMQCWYRIGETIVQLRYSQPHTATRCACHERFTGSSQKNKVQVPCGLPPHRAWGRSVSWPSRDDCILTSPPHPPPCPSHPHALAPSQLALQAPARQLCCCWRWRWRWQARWTAQARGAGRCRAPAPAGARRRRAACALRPQTCPSGSTCGSSGQQHARCTMQAGT